MRRNRHPITVSRGRHCCKRLAQAVSQKCARHPDRSDCPDALLGYWPKYDEYGLIVHDGGSSLILIGFCPWCGTKLPESKRDRWFDVLEARDIDPGTDDVPAEYQTDLWWRRRSGMRLKVPAGGGMVGQRVLAAVGPGAAKRHRRKRVRA